MKASARATAFEVVGLLTLVVAAVFFVATSWRRWPDPLIDFGQELYNAWQLSSGAVLYRDVGCLYGPLSEYLNAGIFWIFGPGLIVIVYANLLVFAAIAAVVYLLFRKAWGTFAAWIATLIFISVFGFSQFVDAGNYNYAAPYAHETTHGMLLCLLLCLALGKALEKPNAARDFVCGLLFGATIVLKPEFILAGFVMTALAGFARSRTCRLPDIKGYGCWALGVVLPTLLFTIYFARFLPLTRAFSVSSQAWLSVFNRARNSSALAIRLIGLDHPWSRLLEGLTATALAGGVILALLGATLIVDGKARASVRLGLTSIIILIFAWLGCYVINWMEIGQCLFGLALIYFFFSIGSFLHINSSAGSDVFVQTWRMLIAGLAIALLARMFLNPRIYHYGYYQAAIAALVPPAVMIGELPTWFRNSRRASVVAAAATIVLVFPAVGTLAIRSERAWAAKTEAIGTGRDRFYCFPAQIDAIGGIVSSVTDVLREKAAGDTLTVLPEGESINYFARLRNPVPHACFYKGAMETETEDQLVADLRERPPRWIVIITRDLIGWGIERYGEKPGSGEEVLKWVGQNYKQIGAIGGDPLDYRERGAVLLKNYAQ